MKNFNDFSEDGKDWRDRPPKEDKGDRVPVEFGYEDVKYKELAMFYRWNKDDGWFESKVRHKGESLTVMYNPDQDLWEVID